MPSFDVGTNPNELQIFIPGEYEINYMIRIAPVETPDQTISAGVRQNGSFIDSTLQYSTLSTTDVTVLQGSVIEFLSGTVDLAFLSTDTACLLYTSVSYAFFNRNQDANLTNSGGYYPCLLYTSRCV